MSGKETGVPVPGCGENNGPEKGAGLLLTNPFASVAVWFLSLFIFADIFGVFRTPDAGMILLYTFVSCILLGTLLPVYFIRRAFIAGTVNMFQIGFRSLRRTFLMVALTLIMGYLIMILAVPAGELRISFLDTILVLLPTAIASVMMCWVLTGTHIQARVRSRGTLVSVVVGVILTAFLFAISTCAYIPVTSVFFARSFITGVIAALFFFSVRDVYATIVVVTLCSALLSRDTVAGIAGTDMTAAYLAAVFSIAALTIVHVYFTRNFRTISLPVTCGVPGRK
jgi:hypothetical protein